MQEVRVRMVEACVAAATVRVVAVESQYHDMSCTWQCLNRPHSAETVLHPVSGMTSPAQNTSVYARLPEIKGSFYHAVLVCNIFMLKGCTGGPKSRILRRVAVPVL